ncbi:MAG: hypothetical protein MI757_06795 [Pirellulales bacterium]|nr:hypothetical protein [Pirellulales bacterium]
MAWSCKVAYYETSNFLRKRRPQTSPEFTALMDAFASDLSSDSREDTPPRQVALTHCVKQLKPHDRSLIDLVYTEGLSLAEVATKIDCPAGGIANSLLRIRRWLLACVQRKLQQEERA